jgi:single-strand DNA-binding protein
MFNIAILTGRLTADPELKTTSKGVSVCSFTIAVDRRFKQGEERQTDFITIVAWRQTAEFVSKHFKKGSAIGIEGSIQTRKYQDKDGNNRTAFEVVANNVQFMESKRSEDNGEGKFSPNIENDPLVELQGKLGDFTEVDTGDELPF